MQIPYPRSFFKLLFTGFLLAVMPLLGGLMVNAFAIQRLSGQSQKAVYDAARIAHASRELVETTTALQRAAQQSVVLDDPGMWEGYRQLRVRFVADCLQLGDLPLEPSMRAELERMIREESSLNTLLIGRALSDAEAATLAGRYGNVYLEAQELQHKSNEVIEGEVDKLKKFAVDTQSRLSIQVVVLLLLAALIVAGFTYLLSRPINQLEEAIRRLGEGQFDAGIAVEGPEDLEQLGRQLDWLRLRLILLEEQKSRFLRHVSHELKTPLTALREGSELLSEGALGPMPERQAEVVGIVRENGLHLQRLIEDLLRYGEAEFRQAPLKLQLTRPLEIVRTVVERQKLALESRNLHVNLRIQDVTILTDADRIRVVLDNLVSNAIKYSPEGGTVTIFAQVVREQFVLEVRDEGPGVSPEDTERIFEPFYQGQALAAGVVQGTGLGLSITREHVMALGGSIEVPANEGRFRVTLPLGEP